MKVLWAGGHSNVFVRGEMLSDIDEIQREIPVKKQITMECQKCGAEVGLELTIETWASGSGDQACAADGTTRPHTKTSAACSSVWKFEGPWWAFVGASIGLMLIGAGIWRSFV